MRQNGSAVLAGTKNSQTTAKKLTDRVRTCVLDRSVNFLLPARTSVSSAT